MLWGLGLDAMFRSPDSRELASNVDTFLQLCAWAGKGVALAVCGQPAPFEENFKVKSDFAILNV